MFAACASLLALTACSAPAALRAGAAPTAPSITVRQTDASAQPPICLSHLLALRYQVLDAERTFTLRVISSAPLCQPVTAVAVVYRMPGNGAAWPQELVERREVVLSAAGVTEIEFTRTCMPAQFDVVTGATPQTISPWGAWHGPLLFPLDVRTAEQDWGRQCETPTTSTVPGTTPTTGVPTTSTPTSSIPTSPTSVVSTTTPGGSVTTTTPPSVSGATTSTVPADVLGATTVPSDAADAASPPVLDPVSARSASDPPRVAGLALTGASITVLVTAGVAQLAVGLALYLIPRFRRPRWER